MAVPSLAETKRDCPDGKVTLPPPGRLTSEEINAILNSEAPLDEGAKIISGAVQEFVSENWQDNYWPSTCYDVVFIYEWPCQLCSYSQIKPYDRLGAHVTGVNKRGELLEGDAGFESSDQGYNFRDLQRAGSEVIVKRSLSILETGMDLLKKRFSSEELQAIESNLRTTREKISFIVGILRGMGKLSSMDIKPAA
jgi:hypothetical protein